MRAGIRLLAERKLIGPSVPRPFVDWIGVIEELLDEARAQHDLLPDVGIKETARIIVAALTGLHQISYAQGGCTDPRACVSTMWHCLLPGIVTLGCLADMRAIVAGFGDDS